MLIKTNKYLILDSFWLKVIALLTMTIDHIGFALSMYFGLYAISNVLRIIGRIAFPIFCFMITEGVIHTRNIKKYLFQLGIMASAILLAMVAVTYIPFFNSIGIDIGREGNIFIDLILAGISVYLLEQPKIWKKILSLVPLLIGTLSLCVTLYEMDTGTEILWFPFFLRDQYGFYGILMSMLFYIAIPFGDKIREFIELRAGVTNSSFKGTYIERTTINLLDIMFLIIGTLIFYIFINSNKMGFLFCDPLPAIISGFFIFFYNGNRGYNANWFKYGSYLYYPVHMLLIFGIFELISAII